MAHEYSIQIHDWISRKISGIKTELSNEKDGIEPGQKNYLHGQLEELTRIRKFLTDQIDLDTQQYYS